jgi:geranylgeranyl reductase family protein
MDTHFDVTVIGAGPAGSAAAYYLARQGFKVALLDKSSFPRDKTCGDGLTPRALSVLDDMGLLPSVISIGHRVNSVEITAPNGRTTIIPLPREPQFPKFSLVVPRKILDAIILERALKSGAEFIGDTHVQRVEQDGQGVIIRGDQQGHSVMFQAKVAVIATGASTKLLVNMGLLNTPPHMIVAARTYFENVEGLSDRFCMNFQGVPLPGYGWVFPVSDGVANIGIGFSGQAVQLSVQSALRSFFPIIQSQLKRAQQIEPVKSYPIRTDFTAAPTFGDHTLLVGEAAGLVNPLTGDGIDYALESGKIAAEHLISAFNKGDLSLSQMARYDQRLRQQFQSTFAFCEQVRKSIIKPWLLNLLVPFVQHHRMLWDLWTVFNGEMQIPMTSHRHLRG